MNFETQLKLLLLSYNSLIYIVTEEEERLEYVIQNLSHEVFNGSVCCWNFIDGYKHNPNYAKHGARNPLEALEIIEKSEFETTKVFLLKDFNNFINDLSIIRKLKNISQTLKKTDKRIIICASEIEVPKLLREYVTTLDFPLPNEKEIQIELRKLLQIIDVNESYIEELALIYKGFTIERIRKSISRFLFIQENKSKILYSILEEKKQLIQQTDILEFCGTKNNLQDIGGLNNLKQWLKKRINAFSKKAQQYGIPYPKGILLIGIQGTGKSLSAKAISQEWKLPLLKLDVGKIFTGIVGQSELRVRKMIKLSEQLAPCILWIDEIDKAFIKSNNYTDSGTSNRVLSSLLNWLSEKQKEVFVVATANNVLQLPPELIRKGRFDEIFFIDLPNINERKNIFQIHLKKIRPLSWQKYDTKYLSQITDKFSGAEIEQVIVDSMFNAFHEKREFTTQDIEASIRNSTPLAYTNEIDIRQIQEWAYSKGIQLA